MKTSKINRILNLILDAEIELTPLEISTKLKIKRTTTRVYLRRLLRNGKIVQPYKGSYCSKITHGMISVPLRVHNICISGMDPFLTKKFPDVIERTGSVKIHVQFGLQRKKMSAKISCDMPGMDKNSCLFALNRFFDIVFETTRQRLENITISTFEVNRDYIGVRLDGVIAGERACYTKKGLFGMIERIYQKEMDVVRTEQKFTKPVTVDEFVALIQGGITSYNLQQGLFMMIQEMKKLTDIVKFQGSNLSSINRFQKEVMDRLIPILDKLARKKPRDEGQ